MDLDQQLVMQTQEFLARRRNEKEYQSAERWRELDNKQDMKQNRVNALQYSPQARTNQSGDAFDIITLITDRSTGGQHRIEEVHKHTQSAFPKMKKNFFTLLHNLFSDLLKLHTEKLETQNLL